MSRYEVIIAADAVRSIRRLPKPNQTSVVAAMAGLAVDPRMGKPLVGGLSGIWSLRRGDYRVLYRIDDAARRVEVARVSHRREIYRRR